MKIANRDTMFVYVIHCGVTREGQPFLEAEVIENVLGDTPHKRCLGVIMGVANSFVEDFLTHHFGGAMPDEEVTATVDDVMDFFENNRTISDE